MTRVTGRVSAALVAIVMSAVVPAAAQTVSPDAWRSGDVGAVAATGSTSVQGDVYTLAGSGADVWGSADEFHFAYLPLTGDGSIVARVTSIQNVNAWTKAGVMIRESLDANARHGFMLASPGKGMAFQRRTATGGVSTNTAGGTGTAPAYVKLTRTGHTVTAFRSTDGVTWTTVGADTIAMSATVYVGLAVSSHVDGTNAMASFANVKISTLPSGWESTDVGTVGAAGRATFAGGAFTVAGAGLDVWGTADQFHFVYQQLTGDGAIISRVTAVDTVNAWTKAGVMMRESLAAGSRQAFMLVSPGKGLAFQRRAATGGTSAHTAGGAGTAPYYLKLARAGHVITASKSIDGTTWTTVGSDTITMGATIYVGLAVSSHLDATLATATFAQTQLTAMVTPPTTPTEPTTPPPTDGTEGSGEVTPVPPATEEPPTGTASLRVVHWNVHHGGQRSDGVTDRDGLTTWMASFKADVFSLNELDSLSNLKDIVNRLQIKTGHAWYYSYDYGIAVLSRFPIDTRSSCIINPAISRMIVQAGLVVNGRLVNIWSAHLDAYDSGVRHAEATEVLDCAAPFAESRIIAGDFNAGATTAEIKTMTAQFNDAWAQAKLLGTATNYSGNCDGCTRNGRIDYVFESKADNYLTLKSAEMIDTRNASGVMPSDHKPMLVVYEVK